MKWRISCPLHLNRVVLSGITPLPCVARILPQRLVWWVLNQYWNLSETSWTNLAGLAELALFTLGGVESHDVIPRLDICDTATDGLHDARSFVPEDNGESTFGVLAGEGICI
jgi:hypothetical protein